jgi:hypothetical protein
MRIENSHKKEVLTDKKLFIFCQRFFASANRHICFFANLQKPTLKKQKSLFSFAQWKTGALMILLILTSCAPQSKESYLKNYKEFVSEVNQESQKYTEQDWEKADEEYKKYTEQWYEKFADELTCKEEMLLTKYKFQYNLAKVKDDSKDFFDTYLKDDYEQLKEQIKYYSENEMNDDIEYILQQAKEFGESANEAVEQIFDELNIKLEELQDK